ncbi:uncharacterized protein LOC107030101 [Solanum pennellii]|uniref:Uncharacterized protein LOC107030101 n=1 Tax=Solanum pennellii TaxID=28526 RepID=A0ABM1HKY0_SOLPN|nr:uncharacterized protein LOC107030101 [Solanum pennellii]
MYDSKDEGPPIKNPQGTGLGPKTKNLWSQEIQEISAKQGLSPRGRKQDIQASQHHPCTSETSSRPMTKSKSKEPFANNNQLNIVRMQLQMDNAISNDNATVKMQNDEGQNMDLYIPRKFSATNRLITSKDHAFVQLNVGHLDESGRYTGQFTTYAFFGLIQTQGDADSALDRI